MTTETQQCQNCKNDFTIEPEDFGFYEKIKVPPPTWCPECRLVRRLIWRNERELYKRKCSMCGKDMISICGPFNTSTVYCKDCWWSDKWDPMSYGAEYDFGKDFFTQFQDLMRKVPLISLFTGGTQVNSDYTNFTASNRDSYLVFGGNENEQVTYAKNASYSKNSSDILSGDKLELCYEDIECINSYRLSFSRQCENCTDSVFLFDCRNCQNCFACVNLRNKSYCIWNTQYSREDYLRKIEEMKLGSNSSLQKTKAQFKDFSEKAICKYAHMLNTKGSTGNNQENTRNCRSCFDVFGDGSENSKYSHYVVKGISDSYDNYGVKRAERVYETIAIGFEMNENSDYYFDFFVKGCSRAYYSSNCISCDDIFGCANLRKKQYCILNRQYSKEEYEALLPKIIKQMGDMPYTDKTGKVYRFGEFFPPEFSPFAYNEAIVQEYFPLDEKRASERGFAWRKREERDYKIDIEYEKLPDDIKDSADDIAGKVIECAHKGECDEQCTEAFKILPKELVFYRQIGVPLPRLCPNCRHYERQKQRNPMRLWHRSCMCDKQNHGHQGACPNIFETSYAPERPEKIYCEECYNKEVY